MASFDMNKPATSTWTPPNVARSSAGKVLGGQSARGKMASDSTAKPTTSVNRTTSVASNMDLPVWSNNVALELSLLLSMYNASNLSIIANSGSISPFGLFPLGLPVPPVPVIPQNQDASRVSTTLERLLPKALPKPSCSAINLANSGRLQVPLNSTITAVDMSQSREHSSPNVTERPACRPSPLKSNSLRRNKGHQNARSNFSFHQDVSGCATSHTKVVVSSAAENAGHFSACGDVISMPRKATHVNRIVATCPAEDVIASHTTCKPQTGELAPVPSIVKAIGSGNYQAKSRRKTGNTSSTLAQPARNPTRIAGSYAAQTIPLSADSRFRDAEAAAILLDLRRGLEESNGNLIVSAGNVSPAGSMQAARAHENSSKIRAKRTSDKGVDFSQTPPAQAVDLSTKPKLKSQCLPPSNTINSKHNFARPTSQKAIGKKNQGCGAALPSSLKRKSLSVLHKPAEGVNASMHSLPLKEGRCQETSFRPASIAKHSELTSLVSHLPSCICAFDNPSSVEGCDANCSEEGRLLHGHQLQTHLVGFNFKKAICEKFSQATTCDAVSYLSKEHSSEHSRRIHSYTVAESTSCARLQPTWSQKQLYGLAYTSAIHKPVRSEIQAKPIEGRSKFSDRSPESCVQSMISSSTLSPGTQQNLANVGSASRVQNNCSKSVVQPSSTTHKEGPPQVPFQDASKPQQKTVQCVTDTSSGKAGIAAASLPTKTVSIESSPRSDFRQTIPSFSALRQKSFELRDSFSRSDGRPCKNSAETLTSEASASAEQSFTSRLPTSNLYRIRNSAVGGSNDSLHSDRSDADVQKQDSGDESDSSGSGTDSGSSGRGHSDESDVESDGGIALPEHLPRTVKNGEEFDCTSPSRTRFVLSRAKFTLSSTESDSPGDGSLVMDGSNSNSGNSETSPSSKVKIRKPTFTFSSGSNGTGDETKEGASAENPTKIPELKCNGDEGQNSFKFKLLQALSKPDSKEGVAVDGKSLRALLGEADYFYHNNKKYVLKRYLTKTKPKEDFIANVAGTNGVLQPNRNVRRDFSNSNLAGRRNQPRIEPRISVTARKRTEVTESLDIERGKVKKSKKREFSSHERKKGTFEQDGTGKRVKLETKSAVKHGVLHNKRRRRIHEIDNLVFEGAGGLTPIPDLSLRDSDVFSNIKLRRREAAKRGIAECATEREKNARKSSLRTKWLKTAAHKRAIANKNRKKSIEKKLQKYRKKNRFFAVKNVDADLESSCPRSSCVRINAGIARPHLDAKAFTASGVVGERKNEITGRQVTERDNGSICTPMPESKQSLDAKGRLSFKCNGSEASDDSKLDEISTDNDRGLEKEESKLCRNKVEEKTIACQETLDRQFEAVEKNEESGRRVSKRISERKLSLDRSIYEKKPDDESAICDSDSVRSDSPMLSTSRGRGRRKRKCSTKDRASPNLTKCSSSKMTRNGSSVPRGRGFTLVSCFPAPSAVTLAAAFGDLQPSYSMKGLGKLRSTSVWEIGSCAVDTKQQLQREMWRNMTLDMFTNGSKVFIHNST